MKIKTWIYLIWKMTCFYTRRHPCMMLWMLFWICWGIYAAIGDGEWMLRLSTCILIGMLPHGIRSLVRRADGHPNAKERLAAREQFASYLNQEMNNRPPKWLS